jgi:two-component sensor histidine kinase
VYTWLQEAQVSLPECLLVPLYLGADEPLGTLWIVSETEGQFDARHADALADLAGFAGLALRMAADQQKLKTALDTQQLLTHEMGHRLKNLLAVVQALMNMAARRSATAADLAMKMTPALQALSAAQTVATSQSAESGSSADLREILQVILAPYHHAKITLDGPRLDLGAQTTNVLALVIHELATNSTKYGALSSSKGTVSIEWRRHATEVSIQWSERGGPPITQIPSTAGFGTLLATKSIAALRGTISPDWAPQGLSVRITVPADQLT